MTDLWRTVATHDDKIAYVLEREGKPLARVLRGSTVKRPWRLERWHRGARGWYRQIRAFESLTSAREAAEALQL